ncbi:hypothetical protein COO91_04601 [Nostoc flagelliforme CCNUN1]|uniref:Uncharacterized protein n=1 Tax=Nostoc flagelliforme CCNUN1 TaxID=2038116 RepID=A0A2K8ST42_9NOSO|nr:hypothetical protein COO91_04601 [Nostoc flagelliforme CCNUN1]
MGDFFIFSLWITFSTFFKNLKAYILSLLLDGCFALGDRCKLLGEAFNIFARTYALTEKQK